MAKNTFDETEGFKDCISSNLPPRAMRYSMENKNNLEDWNFEVVFIMSYSPNINMSIIGVSYLILLLLSSYYKKKKERLIEHSYIRYK